MSAAGFFWLFFLAFFSPLQPPFPRNDEDVGGNKRLTVSEDEAEVPKAWRTFEGSDPVGGGGVKVWTSRAGRGGEARQAAADKVPPPRR